MSDNDYKPFAKLKEIKLKLKSSPEEERRERIAEAVRRATAKPRPAAAGTGFGAKRGALPPPPDPADEETAFRQAMDGVKPLRGSAGGRELAPTTMAEPAFQPTPTSADAEALNRLTDLVEGKVEFELEFTDEYLQGHVQGLNQKVIQQLKGGKLSVEAHLDMHGLNSDQAYEALLRFIRESYRLGRRCLLVIPGRGKNSPGGTGVLKSEVQSWLTRDPLRRLILAFATALPRHGGAGALYVLLRRLKKSQGKVQWERFFPDI